MKPIRLSALLLASMSSAHAANYVVTRIDDPLPGACTLLDCSLREAVNAANANPGVDTISLKSQAYALTRIDTTPDTREADRGPLWVRQSLVIDGTSPTRTGVYWDSLATHSNQVFWVDSQTPAPVALTLSDLTVSHGRGSMGGCIYMVSTSPTPHHLTLEDVKVERCKAATGGAIRTQNVDLSFVRTQLFRNSATYHGGALEIAGSNNIDSEALEISGNAAGADGGAVRIFGMGLVGMISDVVWVDDGTSVIAKNKAGADGGAFSLVHTASLDLSTIATAPAGQLLTISANEAGGVGGGLSLAAGVTLATSVNWLRRVRITSNTATGGGGVHAEVSLQVGDSEIANNVATGGAGGGIALTGSFDWAGGRHLERVSVHGNRALADGGGAIASECASFSASDVAIFDNEAAAGRGQGIETVGNATLRHATLSDNDVPALGSPGLRKTQDAACPGTELHLGNSLVEDFCATALASELASDGGNQLGVNAAACPALGTLDERQTLPGAFALGIDPYGGHFDVVGWPDDATSRPQRDFGLAANCSATDVRGLARSDGFCDAGAFEQGTP